MILQPFQALHLLFALLVCTTLSLADDWMVTVEASDGQPADVYLYGTKRKLGVTGTPFSAEEFVRLREGERSLELDLVLTRENFANTYSNHQNASGKIVAEIVPKVVILPLRTQPSEGLRLAESFPGASIEKNKLIFDTKAHLTNSIFLFSYPLEVQLEAPGYLATDLSLTFDDLTGGTYPSDSEGPFQLSPAPGLNAWFTRTKNERPWLFGLLGILPPLGIYGLVWYRQNRAKLARANEIMDIKADSSDPLVGTVYAGFRIGKKLGSGGMATVYRAVPDADPRVKNLVALKILRREMSEEPEFLKRFHREVRVATSLIHKNIVETHDGFNEDGLLGLSMEMVDGRELKTHIEQGLSIKEGLEYLLQTLRAVHYAHNQGVVHRDLKPGNIMVCEGQVKVMDFGLARSTNMSTMTATGNILGTPAYIPPEQIKSGASDARADQYSLGIMAYEMFTGTLPYMDEVPIALLMKHINEKPRPLTDLNPLVPRWLEKIVLKMMEKEPDGRYPDLSVVASEIESQRDF